MQSRDKDRNSRIEKNFGRRKIAERKRRKWLPNKDSNLNKLNQNQLCYRYTIGHWFCNVH